MVQRALRLCKRYDFHKVFVHGKSAANENFIIHYKYDKNRKELRPFRFGVSASKKIGNAVIRNKMRRRIKEAVRQMQRELVDQVDIVCIVRQHALTLQGVQLQRSLQQVFQRAKLLRKTTKIQRGQAHSFLSSNERSNQTH